MTSEADSQEFVLPDDGLLQEIFFSVVQSHDPDLAEKVRTFCDRSKDWCASNSVLDFDLMQKELPALTPSERPLVWIYFSPNNVACPIKECLD